MIKKILIIIFFFCMLGFIQGIYAQPQLSLLERLSGAHPNLVSITGEGKQSIPAISIPAGNISSLPKRDLTLQTSNGVDNVNVSNINISTLKRIQEINAYIEENNLTWKAGLTSMMLRSPEDQKRLSTGLLQYPSNQSTKTIKNNRPIIPEKNLPSSFDWRINGGEWTTPIKDQEDDVSCWAFASIGVFESYYKIMNKNSKINPDFSEQYLIECGDIGGALSMLLLSNETGKDGKIGTVTEAQYPHRTPQCPCKNLTGFTRYHTNPGDNFYYVGSGERSIPSVDAIRTAIYKYGPVYAGVNAHDDYFVSYVSGILSSPNNNTAGHAINLVGWGTKYGRVYFIGKNCWGTGWGESGWFRIWSDQLSIGEGAAYLYHTPSFAPNISSITPASGNRLANISAVIDGSNFRPGAMVTLTQGRFRRSCPINTLILTEIGCSLPIKNIPTGYWNLTIRNKDGTEATKLDAFQIL